MTATIHPHPRARRPAGLGYPAAFASAGGPGFQWAAPARPGRAIEGLSPAERIAAPEAGLDRPARRAAR